MRSSEGGGVGGVVEKEITEKELHKICGIRCNELNALASGNRLRRETESLCVFFINTKMNEDGQRNQKVKQNNCNAAEFFLLLVFCSV